MGMNDPKNTDVPDDNASTQPSRRSFLKGGAAAAIGAIAGAAVPMAAEAASPCGGTVWNSVGEFVGCPPPPSADAKVLAKALVTAWKDPNYRKRLLTFEEGKSTNWNSYSTLQRNKMIEKTRDALKENGYDRSKLPVVLSQQQFEAGPFWTLDNDERIFQMPDKPTNLFIDNFKPSEQEEFLIAGYANIIHICGM